MTERVEQHRTVVVGLVWNQSGQLLFCKMPPERGVFPGQWGFPGGGMEAGERMEDALRRELGEELGIPIGRVEPAFFKDCLHSKLFPDGTRKMLYMIFLLFNCLAETDAVRLNEEFAEYRWVDREGARDLDLNDETLDTLERLGSWSRAFDSLWRGDT